MQLNEGKFAMNGRCGYVLQPECMKSPGYNPFDKHTLVGVDPITVSITVCLYLYVLIYTVYMRVSSVF